MKDPIEVRLPSRNRILVVPRVEKSGDSVPPTLFDDLPLDFRDSPAVENTIGRRIKNACRWYNSRRQLSYGITHSLVEVVHRLSVHSPVEGSTDIGTRQSEINVVLFIDYRVLVLCEPGPLPPQKRELTRIMVRRMATEPKTALAGVILESSLARFRPSMAMFSEERPPSRPFGCWDVSVMIGTQGGWEKAG